MSLNVLIIPEHERNDRHILQPIVERMLRDLGRPKANVSVLRATPRWRGVDQVLTTGVLAEILADERTTQLFLLLVDRDQEQARHNLVEIRESEHPGRLLACLAIEEVEVWMLALHREELGVAWSEVRAHRDPKEAFAEPFLSQKQWNTGPGGGRKRAMRELGKSWNGLLQVCPELAELKDRIAAWLAQNAEQ